MFLSLLKLHLSLLYCGRIGMSLRKLKRLKNGCQRLVRLYDKPAEALEVGHVKIYMFLILFKLDLSFPFTGESWNEFGKSWKKAEKWLPVCLIEAQLRPCGVEICQDISVSEVIQAWFTLIYHFLSLGKVGNEFGKSWKMAAKWLPLCLTEALWEANWGFVGSRFVKI